MIYPVLTVRQPCAALIVNGYKNVENRNWHLPDKYLNTTVLIYASAKPQFTFAEANAELNALGFGGNKSYDGWTTLSGYIIGAVRFSDCEEWPGSGGNAPSPWCDMGSNFWWMIDKAIVLPPLAANGKLNFWKFDYPHEIVWP